MSVFCCFSKLFMREQAEKIVPVETETPVFPLLDLPIIVTREVIKLLDPIDFISTSLASKTTNHICKSIHTAKKLPVSINMNVAVRDKNAEIKMSIEESPNVLWVFHFTQDNHVKEREVMNDIYILMWAESDKLNKKELFKYGDVIYESTRTTRKVRAIELFTSDVLTAVKQWIDYLMELFRIKLETLFIGSKVNKANLDKVLSLFNENLPPEDFIFASYRKNDDFYPMILDKQNATKNLTLRLNAFEEFHYDLSRFEYDSLEIKHACWVKFSQLYDLKCKSIALRCTKFERNDLKELIRKWRAGWTPKWESLYIKFWSFVNVFECVEGDYDIIATRQRNEINLESQIQLYRFQLGYVCSPKKMIMLYGFHIVRENRDVASILMVDDEMAMFYVQKMDDDLLEINLHADMFERKQ